MDTDSSLPPLLLLIAASLVFAWASVVVATRQRRRGLSILLGAPSGPGVAFIRAVAACAVGISVLAIASLLLRELPRELQLLGAVLVAGVGLIAIHGLMDFLSSRFPDTSRRIARPRRWFADGSGSTTNGHGNGSHASDEERSSADDHSHDDSLPLTPAEMLNLDQDDIDMVRSISRMDDRDVKDIMVPRLDVDAVSVADPITAVVNAFVTTRHSRMPVYQDTMDDVVGVLHISDVLPILMSDQGNYQIADLMRTPEYVAENMALDDLLRLMREKSLQMAIVVDEYGGVEGIVTLEDVLEEIVGEIDDEFALDGPDIPVMASDGAWLMQATTTLEEVRKVAGVKLDAPDVNTIGGYVYTELGRMPAAGDTVSSDGFQIEVTQMRGRRIQRLKLVTSPSGDAEGSGAG